MRIPLGDEITILDENQKKRREAARGHIYMMHTRSHFFISMSGFFLHEKIYSSWTIEQTLMTLMKC